MGLHIGRLQHKGSGYPSPLGTVDTEKQFNNVTNLAHSRCERSSQLHHTSTKLSQCRFSFRDPAGDSAEPQKGSRFPPIDGIRRQEFGPKALLSLQLSLPIVPIVPSIPPLMVAMALFPRTIVHVSPADWSILEVASVVDC